ncbi:MAG TPA: DNA cytosine methyltransferase [Solirubrobacterales bacterium]|nr:DNA cytosine methyltransferase [Solirubrobacterales bacterium]
MGSPRKDALRIVDLFAGPGGWGEGLRQLGYRALGIDSDPVACATAEAAGHERLRADIAALDPADFEPAWGLIASPPCQAYSRAGKGLGKLDKRAVIACARELCAGRDGRARWLARCRDERSILTVEPLRWALALRPRWLAMEQVPPACELWSLFAALLERHGWRCAVGLLSAERFGVPQVRKRAFLIASLDGEVKLPAPTHRSFDPRRHATPEGERELCPWVSMAQALGWAEPAAIHSGRGRPAGGRRRSLERPSTMLDGEAFRWTIEPPAWTRRRPATTLMGDPRVTAPGSWPRCGRRPAIVRGRPVRVSAEQAGVLQGFRHDYPWRGSRSQRFEQIGNAVCPPLAAAVLAEAMRPSLDRGGRRRG